MSWNEPPDGNKNKDPWGKNGSNGGPPDLDEIVRRMQRGFGGIFGKKPSKGGGSIFPFSVVIILLIAWLVFDMTYLVDQQQRGVVLRFGKYITTLDPGLNIRLPRPIEKVTKVNVGQVRSITHKASMLTQDENIVDVEVAVQWRIGTATDFLFNVFDPASRTLKSSVCAIWWKEKVGKIH